MSETCPGDGRIAELKMSNNKLKKNVKVCIDMSPNMFWRYGFASCSDHRFVFCWHLFWSALKYVSDSCSTCYVSFWPKSVSTTVIKTTSADCKNEFWQSSQTIEHFSEITMSVDQKTHMRTAWVIYAEPGPCGPYLSFINCYGTGRNGGRAAAVGKE